MIAVVRIDYFLPPRATAALPARFGLLMQMFFASRELAAVRLGSFGDWTGTPWRASVECIFGMADI